MCQKFPPNLPAEIVATNSVCTYGMDTEHCREAESRARPETEEHVSRDVTA